MMETFCLLFVFVTLKKMPMPITTLKDVYFYFCNSLLNISWDLLKIGYPHVSLRVLFGSCLIVLNLSVRVTMNKLLPTVNGMTLFFPFHMHLSWLMLVLEFHIFFYYFWSSSGFIICVGVTNRQILGTFLSFSIKISKTILLDSM